MFLWFHVHFGCRMDERGVIKVADFGLAEDIYSRNYFRWKEHNSNAKLPVKWLALESLLSGVFSEKTDVVIITGVKIHYVPMLTS